MNKYLISNPKYSGEIECIYGTEGVLLTIDFGKTNMPWHWREAFLKIVPGLEMDVKKSFKTDGTVVVAEAVQISFQMFWEKYSHKFNKDRCEKLWDRLNKTERVLAYYSIDKYEKLIARTNQYKMHPDTWLRNKCFNDYK